MKIVLFLVIILSFNILLFGNFDDLFQDEAFFRVEQEFILVSIGTRGAARSTFYFTVPIEVISAEQIEKSGLSELNDVIQRFLPSFNSPRPSITDGTDHVRPATMRGLGPDQILVLINGKRRHPSAVVWVNGTIGRGSMAVDINSIPVNAIKHIEILKDGAAAQYGSDAIAGIINIVLKDNDSSEFLITSAQTKEGDGKLLRTNLNFGFQIKENGFLNVNTEFFDRDYTNRAGIDVRAGHTPELQNTQTLRHGDPETKNFSIFMNSMIPVTDITSVYSFGNLRYRMSEAGGFYRAAGNTAQNDTQIYPAGFLPLIAPEISDKSIVLGAKSKYNDWSLDFSASLAENIMEYNVKNSLNRHLGPESQTTFYCGTLKFVQNTINFDFFNEKDIDFLSNPLSIGIGGEFRFENFIQEAGEENSYYVSSDTATIGTGGAQVFPGFRPEDEADAKRMSTALYIDLENQLTEKFLVGLAARYENFTDFGSNLDGKFAFRYLINENTVLRGSTSTGFRAPSLGQSHYTKIGTSFDDTGIPRQTGTFAVEHPLPKALGAKPLSPEKSTHFSAGLAYNTFENFDLAIDYFFVDIEDRIILSGQFNASNSPDAAAILERYRVGAVQFWTNALNTRTKGIDIVTNYTLRLKQSERIVFSCALNINKTEITRLKTMEGLSESALLAPMERSVTEDGQPQNILNLSANYIRNNLDIFLKVIRVGTFVGRSGTQEHKEQLITDLNIGYQITDNLKLNIGGNNIFDSYPEPRDPAVPAGLVYDNHSPFGFNGAYYHSTLTYKF